jgi:hypothetical protein
VAVTAPLLTFPTGHLKVAMFPSDAGDATAFTNRLNGYIALGVAQATLDAIPAASMDAATTAWAYSVAYTDAYTERLDRPSSATIEGQGSEAYAWQQVEGWLLLAQQWAQEYTEIVALAAVTADAAGQPSPWATVRSVR